MKRAFCLGVICILLLKALFTGRKEEILLEGRSGSWRRVRNEVVEAQPYCSMCGAKEPLVVHHKVPFHVAPELELDRLNCIVVCPLCHWKWCHDPDGPHGPEKPSWSKWNANIDADVKNYGVNKQPTNAR